MMLWGDKRCPESPDSLVLDSISVPVEARDSGDQIFWECVRVGFGIKDNILT